MYLAAASCVDCAKVKQALAGGSAPRRISRCPAKTPIGKVLCRELRYLIQRDRGIDSE